MGDDVKVEVEDVTMAPTVSVSVEQYGGDKYGVFETKRTQIGGSFSSRAEANESKNKLEAKSEKSENKVEVKNEKGR